MSKDFYDATREQRLAISLYQALLREAALNYATLEPSKRDPIDLYMKARHFDKAVREAGLADYWVAPEVPVTPCDP